MTHKKIMAIDDDRDLLHIIEEYCKLYSIECIGVDDVENALEILPSVRPDLILLDLHFNRGFEGTSFLNCYNGVVAKLGYRPPVIILSSLNLVETVDYVLNLGARGYMSKPFDPQVLMAMIHDYFADSAVSQIASQDTSYDQIGHKNLWRTSNKMPLLW